MNPVQSSHSSATAAAPAIQTTTGNNTSHGYGLPCLKCRTYYDSNLPACPVCNESKRVAVNAVSVQTATPEAKDPAVMEEQRRRFAYELNPQAYSSLSIPAAENLQCSRHENHSGSSEDATICQSCYARLQNRADLMEAALHIDLKEAAQVVYEAVWADPSDPIKTYQNAAQALLGELHKRAGISAVIGPIHPMAH